MVRIEQIKFKFIGLSEKNSFGKSTKKNGKNETTKYTTISKCLEVFSRIRTEET